MRHEKGLGRRPSKPTRSYMTRVTGFHPAWWQSGTMLVENCVRASVRTGLPRAEVTLGALAQVNRR